MRCLMVALLQPGIFQRDLFSAHSTTGETQVGYGVIDLANADGALDALMGYAFDGRPLKICYGSRLRRSAIFRRY